jgi:RNA polymerase sigma-70 factor (ECF subfamily)
LGWCKRLGSGRLNAEDAAHDVFEIVLQRLQSLREPQAFSSWLYGITRRVLAAHRRKAWFRKWLPGVEPEGIAPGPSPLRETEQSEIAARVHDALTHLSADHREVLVLCDLEERADSEVAGMLGVPKGTVKSRLRRARTHLRALVPDLATVEARSPAANGAVR